MSNIKFLINIKNKIINKKKSNEILEIIEFINKLIRKLF